MGEHKCKLEDAFQIADFFYKACLGDEKYYSFRGSEMWMGNTKANFLKPCQGKDVTNISFLNARVNRDIKIIHTDITLSANFPQL